MSFIKKPSGDMGILPAIFIGTGWMFGWAIAFWVSGLLEITYAQACWSVYGLLVVLAFLFVWEHRSYWRHIRRINSLMRR